MEMNSALELKDTILSNIFKFNEVDVSPDPSWTGRIFQKGASLEAPRARVFRTDKPRKQSSRPRPTEVAGAGIAIGVMSSRKEGDFKLAVFLKEKRLLDSIICKEMASEARGEIEFIVTGRVRTQNRLRPPFSGCSVGHVDVTCGTLGCYVKYGESRTLGILSNNHVLANTNLAKERDPIIQPGSADGGQLPHDTIALLANFIPIATDGRSRNFFDAAIAEVGNKSIAPGTDLSRFFSISENNAPVRLSSATPAKLNPKQNVAKWGRTTKRTEGRVVAINVTNLEVDYDDAMMAVFDGQISIEGVGKGAFSKGGDSGSLVVTESLEPAALIFAGTDTGGTNNRGISYATPLQPLLARLRAEVALTS